MFRPRFSTRCRVCQQWQGSPICSTCAHQFSAHRTRCRRCGLSLTDTHDGVICLQCEDYPPEMDQVIAAVDFAAPWSDLIGQLKFVDSPAVADMLARPLAQAVSLQQVEPPDLIVPIPLSAQRWHERGYNQAWLLAQHVARQLGWLNRLSYHTLHRRVETGRLMSMASDERALRIRGAFEVNQDLLHQVAGQRVALVDDVMTTGATANEAARTLLAAGATQVNGWFVARTPAPRIRPSPSHTAPPNTPRARTGG